MSQNTSSAVMQQRSEPHDSLDDFPTQPWATRALLEKVLWPNTENFDPPSYYRTLRCWEPACNRGHMVKPLKDYFRSVHASDIFDYSAEWDGQERVSDFLMHGSEPPHIKARPVDWIITNPPFRLAEQFFRRAFELRALNYAMICRTSFIEGVDRYNKIFRKSPPSTVAQFVERVPMVKGRLTKKGSTATSYCWLIWMEGEVGTRVIWIPPCRKHLEHEGDYS
jgi:hypothetical protein